MKAVEAKYKIEGRQNPLNTISFVYFLQTRMFTEKFPRTSAIHPGIFLGRALHIIHQIFSLARHLSKHVTWPKTGEYRRAR